MDPEAPNKNSRKFLSLPRSKNSKSSDELTPDSSVGAQTTSPSRFSTWKRKFQKKFGNVVGRPRNGAISFTDPFQLLSTTTTCSSPTSSSDTSSHFLFSNSSSSINCPHSITMNCDDDNTQSDDDRSTNIYVNMNEVRDKLMTIEKKQLERYCWYWGSLSRNSAQNKLTKEPNGSFLVRLSQTDNYQFTLSFRSAGCTLHSRIDNKNGYWIIESGRYKSVVELIEDTMKKSEMSVFCYVRSNSPLQPQFPVRLVLPVSRFKSTSLQHLCRVVIQQNIVHINRMNELLLPSSIIGYLREDFYENI